MSRGISTNQNLGELAGCLQREKIEFACRYYSATTRMPEKRLIPAEAKALLDKGIKLVTVYEDGPTHAAYFTSNRGEQDAKHAQQYAIALGQPEGSAIYFAVDYDASNEDTRGPITAYFEGVRRGLAAAGGGTARYEVGVYGSGRVCAYIKEDRQLGHYSWLAESHGWGGHTDYAHPNIRQEIARHTLCSLRFGTQGEYEDNFADGDYGAFSTLQENVRSMLEIAAEGTFLLSNPSPFASSVAALAEQQYRQYHQTTETVSPLKEQIRAYWTSLGYAFPGVQTAWSAIFISWLMKNAGANGTEFRFSNSHSRFVYRAIRNAQSNTGLFRGHPIDTYAPRIGDLIHNNRNGQTLDYDFATAHEAYESHSALVIALGSDASGAFALTVGGNEGDTVGQRRVPLRADGKIAQRTANPFICVVQNLK
jgi:hypothetical protein